MGELAKLTIARARDLLRAGDLTAEDLARSCIDAIESGAPLNAFCAATPDLAIDMAREADRRIATGNAPKLCGIPVGVKDLFCTRGVSTQAASGILDGFVPEYESFITDRLWKAGAVMVGKTNMDEFAMGSSNQNSVYGPVISPWRRRGSTAPLVPGGSSGGSAAAVAANLCLAATGTDTGGSIRQPAAFSGITGIKPTYGRCSRWGIVAFASSLDQAGPLTKSVRDAAIMLETMAGHDPMDTTSAEIPTPEFESGLTGDIRGKTIGVPAEYRQDGMPGEIESLWETGAEMLRDAGAKVVRVSLPHTRFALPAYYVIAPAEASSNLARYDGVKYGYRARIEPGDGIVDMYAKTRAEGFGPEVRRRILIGTYVLSEGFYDAYYKRAQRVRTLIRRDFEAVFDAGVDAILTPATPSAAFGIGEIPDDDPVRMYLNDVFTVTVNLAGLPGISVPAGLDDAGLPLGLQLIGRPWEEAELLNVAYALERAAAFDSVPERWW